MDERKRILGARTDLAHAHLGGVRPDGVGGGADGEVPLVLAEQKTSEDEHRRRFVRLDRLLGITKKALVSLGDKRVSP